MVSVTDQKDSSNNQTLVNDVSGKILQRTKDGTTIRSLVVNGELMGTTGPTGTEADFTPSYRPIDGTNPQAAPGAYTVQAGDTLQSIAQTAYGDSKLWYLVADANGLSGDRDLRVGATVTIPNRVAGNSNDFKTFKPYDAGKIVGDTTPTMPMPTPGGGGGCGVVGTIVMVVVAIVVTYFTAGALTGAVLAASETAGTVGAAAAVSTAASIGIAAASAAVGSIVSQGVGMMIGAQKGFSWSSVAVSAISAGVTEGVGLAAEGAATSTSPGIQSVGKFLTDGTTGTIARAAISNTLTQGISVAAGLQNRFSWAGVAAAAVGAGVASETGQLIPGSSTAASVTRGVAAGFAGGLATAALRGGKVNYTQIAADAFGNALGNSIVDEVSAPNILLGDAVGSFDGLNSPDSVDDLQAGLGFVANQVLTGRSSSLAGKEDSARPLYVAQNDTVMSDVSMASDEDPGDGGGYGSYSYLDSTGTVNVVGYADDFPVDSVATGVSIGGAISQAAFQDIGGLSGQDGHDISSPSSLSVLGQQFVGTAGGALTFAWHTLSFVNDQLWGAGNFATGGWLADHSDAARGAVQRNAALGQAMLRAPAAIGGFAMAAASGHVTFNDVSDGLNNAWHSQEIDRLEAQGDFAEAQAIRTENVLGIASLAYGGANFLPSTARLGANVANTTLMGLQLGAETFAESRTGQIAYDRMEAFVDAIGGRLYAVPPGPT